MAVLATQQIRRMRGGAQSHLMMASDENLYVVKFQNNPQHIRVLANELLATRLAEAAGLSVPSCEVVEVTSWLVEHTEDLHMKHDRQVLPCQAGLQFGSRFVGGLRSGPVVDYLPEEQLAEVSNLPEFAGMLALDKWTCNVNGRQAVFRRRPRQPRYHATFIDQGYCFNAGEWRLIDVPMRGVYARNLVYRGIRGWQDFEPWLSRIEDMAEDRIWKNAAEVPPEWFGGDLCILEDLVEQLLKRQQRVRALIEQFRDSSRQPFPLWGSPEAAEQAGNFPEPEEPASVGLLPNPDGKKERP